MLAPKRVKHRKTHKGRMRGAAQRGSKVSFGEYGLQALEPTWITNRQIESARVAMTRHIKRGGKVWIRIFPDKPITQKPAETRMGKGKGNPEAWVAVVKPGPDHVRAGGCVGGCGQARHGARRRQASDQVQVRRLRAAALTASESKR